MVTLTIGVLIATLICIALFRSLYQKPHFLARAQQFLDDAYCWHRFNPNPDAQTGMFQIRLLDEWRAIVYDKKAITDIFNSSSLLFLPVVSDMFQFSYTMHPSIGQSPDIHRPYLRFIMSHLDEFLPDMMKEIELTLDARHSENNGQFAVMDGLTATVFRALNVVFVGPHLARDPVFRKETLKAIQSIMGTGSILKFSSSFARPFLHKVLNMFMPTCTKAHAMLVNEIRRGKSEISKERCQWDHRGIDVLTEFIRGDKLIDDENILAFHFIAMTLAGTVTTNPGWLAFILLSEHQTLTAIVFDLVQQEGCLHRIRKELQAATSDRGEINAGVLASCPSPDAFLEESLRLCNLGALPITRRATKDLTFSNGIRIATGTSLSVPIRWTHCNPEVYPNLETFDDSRFRDTSGVHKSGVYPHSDPANPNPNFLFFGYGKYACPGRFLAMRIAKCLVAHLVLKYDIRWAHPGCVPRPMWVMYYCAPDPKAEVVISRRGLVTR
ncbi:cytochrome P450 [Phlebopus sp. FC_14]|nr:cytochrome P450 [Phlebopus sp. FC_14]